MRKSLPAYLFLAGLSLSACSEKNLQSPDQPLASRHSANQTLNDEHRYDFPFSPDQYVSKTVQIETPADSSDRFERKRSETSQKDFKEIEPEEPEAGYTSLNYAYLSSFENTFAADAARTATYTFVSSDGIGMTNFTTPTPLYLKYASFPDYIYDVQIAKSSSAGVAAKDGYHKLGLDLNRGSGGKYIYLTFSRTRAEFNEYGQDTYPGYMRYVHPSGSTYTYDLRMLPLNNITARSYRNSTLFTSPPSGFFDVWQFIPQFSGPYSLKYYRVDLNDGAGGNYIRPYKSRTDGGYAPIRQVGIVAGNSSNIWPPSGWIRDNTDLNDRAGGDYIYLCYKR
ncbi:hypothetical protein LGH70_04235 [Hymenobacter sp. BT635]|uniref:MABP domain-containing protein n=1 Tax=Hymenobacter nitidus TaxID=2880929 RepID=A0ABS8ABJ2_9BACT|nr:hypothetical protein [Hymenobacter nitidus]MCB2376774.1 hypothetical protein [Hymenobacter nitidus]